VKHLKHGALLLGCALVASSFMACQKKEKAFCPVEGLSTYKPTDESMTEFSRGSKYLAFAEEVTLTGKIVSGKYETTDQTFEKIILKDGTAAWAPQRYLVPSGVAGVIMADETLVYSEPDIKKNTSKFLSIGQLVGVFPDKSGGFTQVSGWSDKDKGFARVYVKDAAVSVDEKDITSAELYAKALAEKNPKVRQEVLKSASEQGSTLFAEEIQAMLNESPEISAEENHVLSNARPERPTKRQEFESVITSGNVRVRDYPYEEGTEVLATLDTNTPITVVEKTVDDYEIDGKTAPWYKISAPYTGWVFGAFVERK
jgi:hypothetical protein